MDTAIGVAYDLELINDEQIQPLGEIIINTFKVLTGLINAQESKT